MQSLDYVKITDAASAKIKEILSKEESSGAFVRVSVGQGGGCGCSGPGYEMSLEKEPQLQDIVGESNGVKLLLNSNQTDALTGAEIDYESNITRSGFKINNPNARTESKTEGSHAGCGCGH